jgi:hypothetical protein
MSDMIQQNLTPEEITKKGEEIYFNELENELEKEHSGEYLVLEVESKEQFIKPNLLDALDEARKKHSNKVFYIVQIGTIHKQVSNYGKTNYAWIF